MGVDLKTEFGLFFNVLELFCSKFEKNRFQLCFYFQETRSNARRDLFSQNVTNISTQTRHGHNASTNHKKLTKIRLPCTTSNIIWSVHTFFLRSLDKFVRRAAS